VRVTLNTRGVNECWVESGRMSKQSGPVTVSQRMGGASETSMIKMQD
jgi:hypothetical protein